MTLELSESSETFPNQSIPSSLPTLCSIAYSGALVIFCLIEISRKFGLLANPVASFLVRWNDGKDNDFVLTHIYLLLACLHFITPSIGYRSAGVFSGRQAVAMAQIGLSTVAVGDGCASIIGTFYGKTKLYGRKSIEGTLGFVVSATTFTWLMLGEMNLPLLGIIAFSSAVELISTKVDNLVIPVLASQLYFLLAKAELV